MFLRKIKSFQNLQLADTKYIVTHQGQVSPGCVIHVVYPTLPQNYFAFPY